jgi:putative FmdB family regulatory protein
MGPKQCWSKNVPLYEYECDACGRRFEIIEKFSDPPPEACTECGKGPVHRLLSSPAIQFKGSGFYITDYAQKGKSDSSSTTPAGKTSDSGTSDNKTDGGTTKSEPAKSDTAKSDTAKNDGSATASKPKESKD